MERHLHCDVRSHRWEWGRAFVKWTWRQALHCRDWDKHLIISRLRTIVAWFSSKKGSRGRRKVTQRSLLLCEWKLQHCQVEFYAHCVASVFSYHVVSDSLWPVECDTFTGPLNGGKRACCFECASKTNWRHDKICKGVAVTALRSSFGWDELKVTCSVRHLMTILLWPSNKINYTALEMLEFASQTSQLASAPSRTQIQEDMWAFFLLLLKKSEMLHHILLLGD